jgi:peptidoglycan/LPS O-acetylase OafA/YrhL
MGPNLRRWLTVFSNPNGGVRLFFVLSGYLITQLLLQEFARTGSIRLGRFYARRALRIFPAFYAYLLAVTVVSLWDPAGVTVRTWLAAATFTWNYAHEWISLPQEGVWRLGHLWTLAVEQQFYLFWPAVLLWAKPGRALVAAVALAIWCPVARVGTYFLFPPERGYITMMFHTGADSIMIGCIAALVLQSDSARNRLRSWGSVGSAAAAAWLLLASPLAGDLLHGFPVVAGYTLDGLAAAWIISSAHLAPGPFARRFLGRGLLPGLGLISYSLYLWQQMFLSPTGVMARGHVILPLLAAVVAACLSYRLIELPALRFRGTRPKLTTATGIHEAKLM